ncbi:MAG: ATP-binding cassette domain-containing protein, partial [Nitrospirae bacterium]|nr:ATP-binding cassette domain-containing protein [Nitrospirota bacterium]
MYKPLNRLSIDIADIIISVDSHIDLNRFADIDFYKDFRTETNSPHCHLELRLEEPPNLRLNKCIFNPAGNWQLSHIDGRNVLQVGVKGMPDEVVIFNPDYTKGIIYKRHVFELFRRFIDQFILINLLSDRRGFLLHSSGLIWQGKGICFVGPSGAGKSTLIKLLRGEVKEKDLLSDDRLAVRKYRNKWFVYGTPWYGELPVASMAKAELKGIFFIRHSPENYLRRLSLSEGLPQLIKNSLIPFWDKSAVLNVLDIFKRILGEIPCFEMGFSPD